MNLTSIEALYILAAAGFILALKWMSSPVTARRGVITGEFGMLLAVVATLLRHEVVNYEWIFIAFFIGSAIGVPLAMLMPMTHVPQRTAISQACGALASALIGTAEYFRQLPHGFTMGALVLETLLGFLTFTASLMAFGKLQEILPTRPITLTRAELSSILGSCLSRRCWADAGRASRKTRVCFRSFVRADLSVVRRPVDRAHWRCGYAHCDRTTQFLRRAFGLRDGLCAG